jgi:uncharacterized membrane protein
MDQLANFSDNPEELRKQLLGSFSDFEVLFRRRYPLIWLATLIGPAVVTIALLVFFGFTMGWSYPQKLIYHTFLTAFILGRFVILVGLEGAAHDSYNISMQPSELFGLVTYLDFMMAIFVAFHMGVLFRLPYVGDKIAMLVWDGKQLLNAHPWIKRMAFVGLVVFVIFPTSTTGSVGGSIFGRLLGMSRMLTVSGVLLGSVLGNILMWAFAKQINKYIDPHNVSVKIIGIALLAAIVILIEIRYQKTKKKYFSKPKSEE